MLLDADTMAVVNNEKSLMVPDVGCAKPTKFSSIGNVKKSSKKQQVSPESPRMSESDNDVEIKIEVSSVVSFIYTSHSKCVRLGQWWVKLDKFGTFSDEISVHFRLASQNVLKFDLTLSGPKSDIHEC